MGLILIVTCITLVTIDHMPKNTSVLSEAQAVNVSNKVITIILTIGSALFMSIHSIFTKHLTSERIGFEAVNFSFSSFAVTNLFILAIAIPYWNSVGLNHT